MDNNTLKQSFMALVYNMLENEVKLEEKYHKMFGTILDEISNGYERDDDKTQLKALENLYQTLKNNE